MPSAPQNIYTTPNDVYEYVGLDPAQLRLDDRNQASGQTVTTTAAAAVGATSLTVSALQYPLARGSTLSFEQGGMDAPSNAVLSAAAATGATTLSVTALTVAINSGAIAIDNGMNTWLAGMLTKACRYATGQVKRYCLGRYDDSALVNSWSVNQWATTIAARWLAKRCYRSASQGIEEDYKEIVAELKAVNSGQLNIEDIGTRTAGWPFMSNLTLDDRMTYTKVRVEPVISDPTPTQYAQFVDYNSLMGYFGG